MHALFYNHSKQNKVTSHTYIRRVINHDGIESRTLNFVYKFLITLDMHVIKSMHDFSL